MTHKANPHNVPGDFYVEEGCCTSCAVIFDIAPGHFEFHDATGECFVCRQPTAEPELGCMVLAIAAADLRCIRYRGEDQAVIAKLVSVGEGAQCDALQRPVNVRAD